MNPRKRSSSTASSQFSSRPAEIIKRTEGLLSIPGVQINDLLDLEFSLPDIRLNLSIIMLVVVYIGQIRLEFQGTKSNVVQGIESVNGLVRAILAKSPPLTYITAAVSIRKSMAVYANESDDSRIKADHADLSTNLTGPILSSNRGLSALLGSPEKLRSYRRGIMAKTTGNIQAAPIHSPRKISPKLEEVSRDNFLERLPFDTSDIDIDLVCERVLNLISPDGQHLLVTDVPCPTSAKLDSCFKIQRQAVNLPDITGELPDDAPDWKKAAVNQALKLKG
jgi:hypothetical protein